MHEPLLLFLKALPSIRNLLHQILYKWQHDTFIVRWKERNFNADAYVTFSLKPDGSIDRVKMEPVSEETDFSYDFQDLNLVPVKKTAQKE